MNDHAIYTDASPSKLLSEIRDNGTIIIFVGFMSYVDLGSARDRSWSPFICAVSIRFLGVRKLLAVSPLSLVSSY